MDSSEIDALLDAYYFSEDAQKSLRSFDPFASTGQPVAAASWVTPNSHSSAPVVPSPKPGPHSFRTARINYVPSVAEVQDYQTSGDPKHWIARTGGLITRDAMERAYLDLASEMHGFIDLVRWLNDRITELQTPSKKISGHLENCYWCGNQRLNSVPCTHCGRP